MELIRKIADLPNEIAYAAEELAPYRLARYATDLATMFHSFYNSCRVLTDDQALTAARLVLVNATRITLRNVLTMLGYPLRNGCNNLKNSLTEYKFLYRSTAAAIRGSCFYL